MTVLRAIKKLVLGETGILPIGLAITLATAGLLRLVAAHYWPKLGGFIMLAAVVLILLAGVNHSPRKR